MPARGSSRYASDRPRIPNLLLVPVILVVPCLSLTLRFAWRSVLHAYVEEREWYGLGLIELVLLAWAVGFVGLLVCWLLRRRRQLLVAQIVTALVGTIMVQGFVVWEALDNPATEHDAGIASQEASVAAADAGARAYWQELPAWLAALPGRASPWFPPVPGGQRIVWKGVPFPATGTTPDVSGPFQGSAVYVVAGSRTHLLVVADDLTPAPDTGADGFDLVDIPVTGPKRTLARGVTSAVAAPDGRGYAVTDAAALRATLPSGTVTTPIAGARIWGWRRDGVVLSDQNGRLRRWLPDHPAMPPQPLPASSADVWRDPRAVVVPPRGHRMLRTGCPVDQPLPTGLTPDGQREPYSGFHGGVWPVTLRPYDPARPDGCGPSRPELLALDGRAERLVPDGLDLSPDGRYLVSAGLRVLDLDAGTRTAMVDPASQELFLRIEHGFGTDPISTGFWHDDRTVEITAGGSPVAVCTLPAGPCSRTGAGLPRPA